MDKKIIRAHKPLTTVGKLVEAQFNEMDRDLAHMTPRKIAAYNAIVAMTKMLREVRK